jgi:hypothetical protein
MEEEFRKNVNHRPIVSFGSKDDCAEGKVVGLVHTAFGEMAASTRRSVCRPQDDLP